MGLGHTAGPPSYNHHPDHPGHDRNANDDSSSRFRTYGTTVTQIGLPETATWDKESDYPPRDRGRAAWLFLCGCFWLEGLVWGLPFSYGVFERYYCDHVLFAAQSGVAAIGTTGLGIAYFIAPLVSVILQKWPSHRKNISILGLLLLTIALFAASFATAVSHLILTQGLLYGIGGALLYNPFIFYLDEWFIERRGLAYGIFWAGTGVCGTVVPLMMEWGLAAYGFRTVLRVWGAFVFVTLSLLVYFVRPRLPLPAKGKSARLNLSFLRTTQFWIFQCGNIIEGLGYFLPQIYLPSYANSLGLSPVMATLSISLLNGASIFGPILIGMLVDRFHVSTVLLLSSVGAAFAVFFVWGFAVTGPVLYLFVLIYGIFAGGYTATWTGAVTAIQRRAPLSETGVILGMMASGRGIGSLVSGPLSEQVMGSGVSISAWSGAYDGPYSRLIVFTGITAVLGGLGVLDVFGGGAGPAETMEGRAEGVERDALIRSSEV